MEITSTPKRLRALPRVWQRFLYLNPGDLFFIGRCHYMKLGFFKAGTIAGSDRKIYLPPWRKVQTDVLVRDARPGGKSSFVVDEGTIEGVPGKTLSEAIHDRALRVPNDWKGRLIVTTADPDCLPSCIPSLDAGVAEAKSGKTHFVGDDCPGGHADKPVNNDNNITGPTS